MSRNTRKDWEKLYLQRHPEDQDLGPLGGVMFWPIEPVAAPRQVQRDKWDPSPAVQRYRAFRDEIKHRRVWSPLPGDRVFFLMPIPPSRRNEKLHLQPHEQVPDADNLLKAVLDACYGNDAHIWTITPIKLWSERPGIIIERRAPDPAIVEFVAAVLPN